MDHPFPFSVGNTNAPFLISVSLINFPSGYIQKPRWLEIIIKDVTLIYSISISIFDISIRFGANLNGR